MSTNGTESYIEELDDEINDQYSNDDVYNITSWGADLSFRELITMYDEGEMLKPELQRHYVWDKVEASRFVESLLLGLPVPSIFLSNSEDDRKLIIDGYQRIMTVYDFVKGVWSKDSSVFKLSGSERINTRWRGKTFSTLTDAEQRKIRTTTIHAIIFEQIHPGAENTSLYQIFERINTGGRPLAAQEIRNCVYQGPLNTMLFRTNSLPLWRNYYRPEIDPRMKDMEFILRFFALNSEEVRLAPKGNFSLKKLLNEFMGNPENNSEDYISSAEEDFEKTIKFINDHIGSNAFYNFVSDDPSKIRRRFYPTIFDSVAIATSIALKRAGNSINTINLEERRLELLQNTDYRKYISEGTMQAESIQGRIGLALETLYGIQY